MPPLSQTPAAIAARARRAVAAAQRVTTELTFARRAVETALRNLEEAQRPRVYTIPPSAAPSAVRARERRAAARIDLATYDLTQAQARLARATAPRPPRAQPPAAPVPAADRFETAIENIYNMAERAVNARRGDTVINISVVRTSTSAIGRVSAPYTDVYNRTARELFDDIDALRNTILYVRDGYSIVSISAAAGRRIAGVRQFQVYLDGPKHCVLDPIIELFDQRIENSSSDKRRAELTALQTKARAMAAGEYAGGIPESDLPAVALKLRVSIEIRTPCQEDSKAQIYTPRGTPHFTAKFINTRLNHVEPQSTLDNAIPVSRDKLKEIYEELRNTDVYYEYNVWKTWIRTQHGKYVIENPMLEFVSGEEKRWGLSRLCAIKEPELTAYIKCALVTPGHHDFQDTSSYARRAPDGTLIPGYADYQCIDMARAYTQGHTSPYYSQYPARITNFGQTSMERGVGFYTLVDIVLTPKVTKYDSLFGGLFKDGCVYCTPTLRYLDAHGCTYKIVAGAWGTACDIDFSNPLWNTRENDNAPPLYSKTVGTWMIASTTETYYVHGNEEFLSHVAEVNKDSPVVSIFYEQSELSVTRKKDSAFHLIHDAAFVTDYVKLAMLLQVEEMDEDMILRAGSDCLYYKEIAGFEPKHPFRTKEGELMKTNIASPRYMSILPATISPAAEYIERSPRELHRGPGGCGKTWAVCKDRSLVRLLVVTPSHILAASHAKKYGVRTAVVEQLKADGISNQYMDAHVICFDECYQLSEATQLKLMDKYGHAMLIFCGDNCQLPHFQEEGVPTAPFNEKLFPPHAIIDHKQNFRCKCDILGAALAKMRDNIENGPRCAQIARALLKTITKNELVQRYDSHTYTILTHTKASRKSYTDMMKAAGKPDRFRVKRRVGEYYNGSIVYSIEAPLTEAVVELQHASTVHSCQGLEIPLDHYVAIDQSALQGQDGRKHDGRMAYTALSRAQKGEQLILIAAEPQARARVPLPSEICCFEETASVEKAQWLMSRTDEEMDQILSKDVDDEYLSEVRECGEAYAKARREGKKQDTRKNLQAYCNRVISNGGRIDMGYRYSEENRDHGRKEGRLNGIGACMQRITCGARGFFLIDTDVIDVDMKNAHPCLALKVARHHGLPVPCLERYISHRDEVIRENNIVKQDVLIMLNREARVKEGTEFIKALDEEFKLLQNTVWHSPEYSFERKKSAKRANKLKGTKLTVKRDDYNLRGTYLNRLFCQMENVLLQRAVALITPARVHGLYFDGLMVKGSADIEALNTLTADHGIKWDIKPHCSRIQNIYRAQ